MNTHRWWKVQSKEHKLCKSNWNLIDSESLSVLWTLRVTSQIEKLKTYLREIGVVLDEVEDGRLLVHDGTDSRQNVQPRGNGQDGQHQSARQRHTADFSNQRFLPSLCSNQRDKSFLASSSSGTRQTGNVGPLAIGSHETTSQDAHTHAL